MKPVPLTKGKLRGRRAIKRVLYSLLLMKDALMVAIGRAKPLVRFTVEASPPSVYFNFEVRPEAIAAFEEFIAVPMPLSPIACLEGEEPAIQLTLNVYRVSGLASGIRAEWSTYVADDEGVARYMVVEADCEKGTLDSVDLFTVKGRADYRADAISSEIRVGEDDNSCFSCAFTVPDDAAPARSASEWVTANDFIYWRNGVCDRTFYDVGLANPQMRRLEPESVAITDTTHWARFIEPVPRTVVVFDNAIDFAISPWWNLDTTSPGSVHRFAPPAVRNGPEIPGVG